MALSTNFTETCLRVLREGRLHTEINKKKNVINVINELFYAQWFSFYEQFRAEPARWIQHKEDTKAEALRSPVALVARFRDAMKKKVYTEQQSFTDMGDKSLGMQAAGASAGAGAGDGAGSRYAAR